MPIVWAQCMHVLVTNNDLLQVYVVVFLDVFITVLMYTLSVSDVVF
jgi:hypothetical protein